MDTWTNDRFRSGKVAYDRVNKEYVLISNGKCTLPHDSPEAYKQSHTDIDGNQGCKYRASECIRLRILGMEGKKPIVAYTYTRVNQDDLEDCEMTADEFRDCMTGNRSRPTSLFVGRV